MILFFAVLTMTAGNLLALNQRDIRYVLAYSSVAQMGYILLGFGIGMVYDLPLGLTAGLYYAIAYAMMKAGAFISIDAFARDAGSFETEKMRGLGAKYPILGISFDIFIFGTERCSLHFRFSREVAPCTGRHADLDDERCHSCLGPCPEQCSLPRVLCADHIDAHVLWDGKRPAPTPRITIPLPVVTAVVFLAFVTVYFGLFPASFDWISHASAQIFTWGVA